MKDGKRFPWFEAVTFLLIFLLSLGSNLVTHEHVVASNENVTVGAQQ